MEATPELHLGGAENRVTKYFAALLNTVASLALALLVPTFLMLSREIVAEHAPGLTAVAGGVLESFFSLRFAILFLVFFSGFYLARQSSKAGLRILLFWIPASVATALGFTVWAWIVHVTWLMQPLNPPNVAMWGFWERP